MDQTRNSGSAFTLIEVLIAIALGGMIVVASSVLMMSITQIWLNEESIDDFQDHINGVSTFVQQNVKRSYYLNNKKFKNPQFSWPPGANRLRDPASFSFTMVAPHPFISGVKAGPVKCYLEWEKSEGLNLAYHAVYKTDNEDAPLYIEKISPWVTEIRYQYYNPVRESWDDEDKPKIANNIVPEFLKLVFNKDDIEYEVYIPTLVSAASMNPVL